MCPKTIIHLEWHCLPPSERADPVGANRLPKDLESAKWDQSKKRCSSWRYHSDTSPHVNTIKRRTSSVTDSRISQQRLETVSLRTMELHNHSRSPRIAIKWKLCRWWHCVRAQMRSFSTHLHADACFCIDYTGKHLENIAWVINRQ